jgi:hypothetical protein
MHGPKNKIVVELFILVGRLSSPAQDNAILPVHGAMELNRSCQPNDLVHYQDFIERIQVASVEHHIQLPDVKIIRKVIMIPHLPNSMNMEDGLVLNKS